MLKAADCGEQELDFVRLDRDSLGIELCFHAPYVIWLASASLRRR